MLSLYIHIPFCRHKCTYCSFFVLPEEQVEEGNLEGLKDEYLQALIKEMRALHEQYGHEQIRTIYIWGGTPYQLWQERLLTLIDTLLEVWDCEFLEELTVEINPDPFDGVLGLIKEASVRYKNLYKLRWSLGIQTFDDEILKASKRNYWFNNLINFFREMQQLKQPNVSYNADFIAFWKFTDWGLRTKEKREFFTKLVDSQMFDGFSLYTLELFPWSDWYNDAHQTAKAIQQQYGTPEQIIDEFHILKNIIEYWWNRRYELSNFARLGQESIHNMVYRNWWSYLGIGINSASYLSEKHNADGPVRYKNTHKRKEYLAGNYKDTTTIEPLSPQEQQREKILFLLRTGQPVQLDQYESLLEPERKTHCTHFAEEWYILFDENTIKLTPQGMDVYNHIVTEIFITPA